MAKRVNIKRFWALICVTMMLLSCFSNVVFAAEASNVVVTEESNNSSDVEPYAFVGEKTVTVPSYETRVVYLGTTSSIQFSSIVMITTSSSDTMGGVTVSIYNGLGDFKKSFTLGSNESLKKHVTLLGSGPYRFEITNMSSRASNTVSIAIH